MAFVPPLRCPPSFIEPCLPTHARAVPAGTGWAYEIKHDGFRFICRRDGERVRVFSRQGNDWTDRVPLIAGGCGRSPRTQAIAGRQHQISPDEWIISQGCLQKVVNALCAT